MPDSPPPLSLADRLAQRLAAERAAAEPAEEADAAKAQAAATEAGNADATRALAGKAAEPCASAGAAPPALAPPVVTAACSSFGGDGDVVSRKRQADEPRPPLATLGGTAAPAGKCVRWAPDVASPDASREELHRRARTMKAAIPWRDPIQVVRWTCGGVRSAHTLDWDAIRSESGGEQDRGRPKAPKARVDV